MSPRVAAACWTLSLAVLPAAASEGGGSAGSALITPKFGLIFWTTLTFILLVVFLRLVAWKPILGALDERARGIRDGIDQARKDRDDAHALLEQHRALIDQARRERSEAVEEGRRDAERLKGEILAEAKHQREQILSQAEAQVEAAVRQARNELRGVVADLAIQAAGKLLEKNLDEATHRRLVEEYVADLERRSGGFTSSSS